MNKHQYIAIGAAFVLLGILLFGFEKKPAQQKLIEKSRAENFENTSIDLLMTEAMESLDPATRLFIEKKMQLLSEKDSSTIEDLIDMSGEWYRMGKYAIAGYYAEQVAKRQPNEEAWSIAGTTYAQGIRNSTSDKEKAFCANRAIDALNQAISINPDNLAHRVNLGICYADFPPADNPMKGIQILLQINDENPDYVPALLALGRLAIQTGQWQRATQRLEKATLLRPGDNQIYCLLAEAYQGLEETKKASDALAKCNS